ncbi:MAG: ATP-binding protein [Actinomycetota bacterium]|nr:ATP-binding protein [Actinomycetota bacterium]
MAMLVRKALLRLSVSRRYANRVRRVFGVLKSFQLRYGLPDGTDVVVGIDPEPGLADSGVLDDDLAGLFLEVGEVAREQGDGLPSLPALAGEAKSYAERLFSFIVVDSLPADEAHVALLTPAEDEGVRWNPAALDSVVEAAEGYPYFLQEFEKQTWDVAPGHETISEEDVEAAIPIAIDELDPGFFRVRIDRTSDSERGYISAMASLGAGPYGSGDVAAAMGKTTTQVGPLRDALIKRGLCYSPRYGVIDFTVPMFDEFVRRWQQ